MLEIENRQLSQSWARDNFLASQQRNKASGTSQGPEKNQKIVRPESLNGVATINIVNGNYKQFCDLKTWSHYHDRIVACPALVIILKPNFTILPLPKFEAKK